MPLGTRMCWHWMYKMGGSQQKCFIPTVCRELEIKANIQAVQTHETHDSLEKRRTWQLVQSATEGGIGELGLF